MSLPTNNKKTDSQLNKNQKNQGKGSKFMKSAGSSKPAAVTKKVRSTGANREVNPIRLSAISYQLSGRKRMQNSVAS